MDLNNLKVGTAIQHPIHGAGIVTFVGSDYLGIAFEGKGDSLIRREVLEREMAGLLPETRMASKEDLSWPDSTFRMEPEGAQHYLGSHWEPFAEDSRELLSKLPEVVPNALLQTGYGDSRKPPRAMPEDWPKGFQLVWPLRVQGLALILRPDADSSHIVSLFPFSGTDSQQTLTLREVTVWEGGLEAQITASWGEAEITFFDSQFVINRTWYETGRDYDFILSGIAYAAAPAEKQEMTVNRHPDEIAWLNQRLKEGEAPHEATTTVSFDGASILLPVEGWDRDDYSFRAPIESVTEFKDWLGQDGWRVRASVMRFGDEKAELDILITRRAWQGNEPPRLGQDIEGRLWLQGYLWYPHEAFRRFA